MAWLDRLIYRLSKEKQESELVIVGRVSISSAINLSESRLLSRDRTTCNTFSFTRTPNHTRMDTYMSMDFCSFRSFIYIFFPFFSLSLFFLYKVSTPAFGFIRVKVKYCFKRGGRSGRRTGYYAA